MSQCHCGNEVSFEECCLPFHENQKELETAEQCLRSRYSAFVTKNMEYIRQTIHPESVSDFDAESAQAWSEESEWLGLEIKEVSEGGAKDPSGEIEFIAVYSSGRNTYRHHEKSNFEKVDNKWYFKDAYIYNQPIERDEPKVGRNDPCPCGSGKKFKKCCLNKS
jgi:SEC-C motif domain protein